LPKLSRLFGLSFIGENSSMAYTVSGAFVGFVHERYGADAVRAWYRGVPLDVAAGHSMADLESEFIAELDRITLPEAAAIQGKAKFDRPGFFARKCPRFVDGCRERAAALVSSGDFDGALRELANAREFEPENPSLRLDQAEAELAKNDDVGAMTAVAGDESVPRFARDKALEALADHALSTGDGEAAATIYRELIERTIDESKLRTLYVKLAGSTDPVLRRPLALLLVGEGKRKPDRALAFSLLGPLDRDRPDDGLAAYLFGRYSWDQSDYPSAIRELQRALSRKIEVPRVRPEAIRLELLAAAAAFDCETAARALADYRAEPTVPAPKIQTAERVVRRCSIAQKFR
jgi:tetratricopeptide (TPR) repeat protein